MTFNILGFAVTFLEATKNLVSQKWIIHALKFKKTLRGKVEGNYRGQQKMLKVIKI